MVVRWESAGSPLGIRWESAGSLLGVFWESIWSPLGFVSCRNNWTKSWATLNYKIKKRHTLILPICQVTNVDFYICKLYYSNLKVFQNCSLFFVSVFLIRGKSDMIEMKIKSIIIQPWKISTPNLQTGSLKELFKRALHRVLQKSSTKELSKRALQESSPKESSGSPLGVSWESAGSLLGVCWESAGSPLFDFWFHPHEKFSQSLKIDHQKVFFQNKSGNIFLLAC